jgi:hypothetical protein
VVRAAAVIFAGLFAAEPAAAVILFATGEDTGISVIGAGFANTTTAARFRAGYGRLAMNLGSNSALTTDPPDNRVASPTFTAGSLLWIHGQFFDIGTIASTLNQQSVIARSPDGVSRIVVRQTGTYGILKVSTRNAVGTLTDLATASSGFTNGVLAQFDMKIDYSAGGGVQLWIAGVQVINYSGDPRTDSATTLNQIELACFSVGNTQWSEVIVTDGDTRNMGMVTLQPVAAGNTQAWTPNTVTNINETTISDATFITDSTGGALSQWTTPVTIPGGNNYVLAIVQEARLRGAGASVDWSVRSTAADYLAGAPVSPTASFVKYGNRIWATDPAGGAWVPADITGGGLNLGIRSVGAAVATDASKINAYAIVSTTAAASAAGGSSNIHQGTLGIN